ncbi:MAG: nucleotidyltransferase domain-containing protein [bacterium]
MSYGLPDMTIDKIKTVLTNFPDVEKAILYGSRAKGNYKNGSDIDLTIIGNALTLKTIYKIENALDDLLLPYKIDLSIYENITNPALTDHINRVGIIFYEKKI